MVYSLSGKPLYVMHLEFHNKEINKKQKIDQVATNHANENEDCNFHAVAVS